MDPWERQRTLARTTVVWAVASIGAGAALALRRDPWWRAFGLQHVGWGAADLAIVGVLDAVERRRVRRLPDPYAPSRVERKRRGLRTILIVNARKASHHDVEYVYDILSGAEEETDVVLDDRDVPVGWKLNDADLIGYPFIVVLGKAWTEREAVELQCRRLGVSEEVDVEDIVQRIGALSMQL